ncbi:hypothetical protein JXA80_06410 [bacterium]|nr:hypothetical protein [candidate division CSSED10-310 bacterium]
MIDHLAELFREETALHLLRFPPRELIESLDDLAETDAAEIAAMPDPFDQRIAILNRILGRFLTRRFVNRVQTTLETYLQSVRRIPRHFRAVSAGLYFLEIHNRQGGEPGVNPLWNMMFDLSHAEALTTAGGTLTTAARSGGQTRPMDTVMNDLDLDSPEQGGMAMDNQSGLSEETMDVLRRAVQLINGGRIELGFALDTILLGLRALTCSTGTDAGDPAARARGFQDAFRKEIGMLARNDLICGLEYAIEESEGERRSHFETLLQAVHALPVKENPFVFTLYYHSVKEMHRYVKPGEDRHAEAIAAAGGAPETMMEYGRYLVRQSLPHRALNVFMAVITVDPSNELARLGAGIACWLTESFREARMHWDRSARLWSGYLPFDHPDIVLVRYLSELDNFAELPEKAYHRLLETVNANEEE